MRRKLMGLKLSLLLAVCSVLLLSSCNKWMNVEPDYDSSDSVFVADLIDAAENPTFTTVAEITGYQQLAVADYSIDSTFRALPEQVLMNVATVLIKRVGYVTKKSIVEEYQANESIYVNLPSSTTVQQNDTTNGVDRTATDLGNKRSDNVISSSKKYRTDTVDGKPKKVEIKTEESYVD